MIGRKGVQVRSELLDPVPYVLVESILRGESLGEVCERIAASVKEDEALPIADWFAGWAREGLIIRCEIPEKVAGL